MLMTKRKPATVAEILVEEFMTPMGLTQAALAERMDVQRKHINERRAVTAPTALILARVLGNSPDFWLNVQRRSDLWEAMHSPRERRRIERTRPLKTAAWHRLDDPDRGGSGAKGHRVDKQRMPFSTRSSGAGSRLHG
jgi:antitoxin HigA-1